MDLINLFVFRPNRIDGPDGRPFYAYNITEDTLQRLDSALSQPKCTDTTRVKLLAFVAAEHFRRTYRDQVWSWVDCGETVSSIRDALGNIAFYKLILRSLKFWGLKPLKVHGRYRYLGSVVAYGGFPVAFLSGQSSLRALLRHLLRERMTGGYDELRRAANVAIPPSNLPHSFKLSPFFADLCMELVDVIAGLANQLGSKTIQLKTLNEEQPDWKRKLPFSLDSDDAEQLVTELLNVAVESAGRANNNLMFKRSIVRIGDVWTASTRIADLPSRISLPEDCQDTMYRLELIADGEVVQEIARLARQRDGLYVAFPRLRPHDLQLDPSFSPPATTLSIQVANERASVALPIDGGEPLDEELPWIFESVNQIDASSDGSSTCELLSTGSVRTRLPFAIVAIRENWRVAEGAWSPLGKTQPDEIGSSRDVMRVEGAAVIDAGEAGHFTIRCGAPTDGPRLNLTGNHTSTISPAARYVFRGEARVSTVPATEDLVAQWRSVGDGYQKTWSTRLQMAKGLVRYRLSDRDVSVTEARALLLPESFMVQSSHAAVKVTLEPGWRIDAPDDVTEHNDVWRVPVPTTHDSAKMDLLLSSPYCVRPVVLRVPVFSVRTGFRRLADGAAAPERLTVSEISEYIAYANGTSAFIWLTINRKLSFPYRLRTREGMPGSRLPLSLIQRDIRDLRYSSDEIDVPLTLSLGQTSIALTPQRLLRKENTIRLREKRDLLSDLRLRHLSLEHECTLKESDEGKRSWNLPDDFPAGWAIVSASEMGIRPLALFFGEKLDLGEAQPADFQYLIQLEGSSPERVERLAQHLRSILDHAVTDTSADELEYLSLWMMRFDDLPVEYLDTFRAIASSPSDAIRLMAYYQGGAAFDPLSAKLGRIPLYWHLSSKHAWDNFLSWWNILVGSDQADLTRDVIQDLAITQIETMALDADLVEMYQGFVGQRAMGSVQRSAAYRSLFNQKMSEARMAWRNKVALLVEDFHGEAFPPLDAVSSAADKLRSLDLLDLDFQDAYSWAMPVLVAPIVTAWVSHDGIDVSDDLRRELAYTRHLGMVEFDRLYAYAAMLLEQM